MNHLTVVMWNFQISFEAADAIALAKRFGDIKTASSRDTFSSILSWAEKQFEPLLSSILAQNPELLQSVFQEKGKREEKIEIKMPEGFDPKEFDFR